MERGIVKGSLNLYEVEFQMESPLRIHDIDVHDSYHYIQAIVDTTLKDGLEDFLARYVRTKGQLDRLLYDRKKCNQLIPLKDIAEFLLDNDIDSLVYTNQHEDKGQDSYINTTTNQVKMIKQTKLGLKEWVEL